MSGVVYLDNTSGSQEGFQTTVAFDVYPAELTGSYSIKVICMVAHLMSFSKTGLTETEQNCKSIHQLEFFVMSRNVKVNIWMS